MLPRAPRAQLPGHARGDSEGAVVSASAVAGPQTLRFGGPLLSLQETPRTARALSDSALSHPREDLVFLFFLDESGDRVKG